MTKAAAELIVGESVLTVTTAPLAAGVASFRVVRWAERAVGGLGSKALAQVCKNGRCQRLNPARLLKPCSFTEDTPVLMCDGSLKSIDEVEIGDWVLARSKETGELACREVMNLSAAAERSIILVTLESQDGTSEVIETTENHPFFVEGRGWTRVDELVPGDLVPSASGGLLVVSALEWTDRIEVVYNFGVDEFHTYFVGEVGAWVHNCIEDLLKDAIKQVKRNAGPSEIYVKQGGLMKANSDFDSLALSNIRDLPDGRVGQLTDGRNVVVRSASTDGRATLEIQGPEHLRTKIRYENE